MFVLFSFLSINRWGYIPDRYTISFGFQNLVSLNVTLIAFVRKGLKYATHLHLGTIQGQWKWSDHSDLGHAEKFAIYGQSLIFQNFGQTNNCAIEVLLKWTDQSRTPSPAPAIKAFKGSQH